MPAVNSSSESSIPLQREPIHVVHVVESFAAGCLVALATLCHTVRDGIQHSIIHALRPESPDRFVELFPANVAFYFLPMTRSIRLGADLRAFKQLCVMLRRIQPDVVHCHSSKAGFLGRWAARREGLPSVYTPHGYAFLRTDVGSLQRACFKIAEWVAARAGNAIVACGEEEYALSRWLAGRNDQVFCIPNSLNLVEADALLRTAPPARLRPDAVMVGTCGRLEPQRNPALFSALVLMLKDEVRWTWIGAPRQNAALPPQVECPGWLSRGEALARLAALDVYVQTSLWEGLSYAVLEAMALGKAVVATDIPANRNIVRHGVTGFLGSTPQELASHVHRLVHDAPLRRRMGAAARRCVEERHDAQKAYLAYDRLYHGLAGDGKP